MSIATRSCETAARMIRDVTDRFIGQSAPATDAENDTRRLQHGAWLSKVRLISFADDLARTHPQHAPMLFEEVKEFCDIPLPKTQQEATAISLRQVDECRSRLFRIAT
jgi:hypothetical protein